MRPALPEPELPEREPLSIVQIIAARGYEAVYATRPARKGASWLERCPVIAWALVEDDESGYGHRLVGFHVERDGYLVVPADEDDDGQFLGYRRRKDDDLASWEEAGETAFREWIAKQCRRDPSAHPLQW